MTGLFLFKTIGLFILTAIAEIIGCYLPYLWLNKNYSPWVLVPAAVSLALFAYLLTLHPEDSGRIYAAYGGIYVVTALVWLRVIDQSALTSYDIIGSLFVLVGMGIIVVGWR